MRTAVLLLLAGLVAGCGGTAYPTGTKDAHGHGGTDTHGHAHKHGDSANAPKLTTLDVLPDKAPPAAGRETTLRVRIPGAAGEGVKVFEAVHDAKVHLIVVRDGLDHFVHLHPEVDAGSGVLSARYTFPAPGTYHLFADYKQPGKDAATAVAALAVPGDAPKAPALTPNVPGTASGDGLSANVRVEGLSAGKEATVRFEVIADGKAVTDLEPYMGAMGHLVVISHDATRYVHAHPKEGKDAGPNVVAFEAHFPAAGLYKGWGQFKRGGTVRVIPFVVQVN
jgi:hypothetical protein